MQVFGGGNALQRGPEDEGHHPRGNQPNWQESVVLIWWDLDNDVGGFFRIGHEPNDPDGPRIALWSSIFTPDYVFKRTEFLPLRPEDKTENGFGGGDDGCRFDFRDGKAVWTIREDDVNADLTVTNFHTPIDIYPKKGTLGEDFAPNHMECAGAVIGTMTVKGRDYQINGMGFRDHGWGKRNWEEILSHRWIAGVFGPDLAVLAITFLGVDDQLIKFGCAITQDQLIYTKDLDVLFYVEADGLTHRGGHVRMDLLNDECIEFEAEVLQKGAVNVQHGLACTDTMCKMIMGDRIGICDYEMTENSLGGSRPPKVAVNGYIENGLHRA